MIPIIDIFAGPGGLGEGFTALRAKRHRLFRIALSIEKDKHAHETLLLRSFFRQFEHGSVPKAYYQFVRGEITREKLFEIHATEAAQAKKEAWQAELGVVDDDEVDRRIDAALTGNRKRWVLIGGPPCQAYSIVGRVRIIRGEGKAQYEKDERHYLYKQYLRIIEKHQPPVFVMENVKGLLSAKVKGDGIFGKILEDLKALKYSLHAFVRRADPQESLFEEPSQFVIRCERHGVPQARHRVILLGLHKRVEVQPDQLRESRDRVPMWQAIEDLPPLRSRLSKQTDSPAAWEGAIRGVYENLDGVTSAELRARIKASLSALKGSLPTGGDFVKTDAKAAYRPNWFHDTSLRGIPNHCTRGHLASDLQRYFFAACFAEEKSKSPVLSDFPVTLLPDHENVSKGIDDDTVFIDRFRVQVKFAPSTTVTSHISKDGHYFIHPDPAQCRSLTVREAARLQTFPDNYVFLGPRTAQYQQVGNAVPPLLAKQLARVVYKLLCKYRT